ncbi:hypothetical protein [Arthrobacter sp. C152]
MDIGLMAVFWGVSLLFVITPGADWAYAIGSGVRRRAGVLPAVTGMLTGHITATIIVASGVAAVLASSETAMTALTAGAPLTWFGSASAVCGVPRRRT